MNAVIYARYSSDNQREMSIDGQIRVCREYAAAHGMTVIHEYIDKALSASKETEKRLDFLKMMQDSTKGAFDVVLVWKLDRFARDRHDSIVYNYELKKHHVKLISATEPISDTPEGELLQGVLESLNEFYSKNLATNVKRGQDSNALAGLQNGGWTPFGYVRTKEQKLAIDPLTAPIVREIFKRYADGDTIASIVRDLNERGIKPFYGDKFNYSTLGSILSNRKYIGEYKYRDIVIPDGVPAIVDQHTFDLVQARRAKNKRTPAAAKASERYLLTSKLFCGKCGTQMVGESGKARNGTVHRYYKCLKAKRKRGCNLKAVKKEWIEELVLEQTMRVVMDDALMRRIADRLFALQSEENYDVKLLERQLAEVETGIENMLNAIQAGILTESTKQRLTDLEAQKVETEQALAATRLAHPALSLEQIMFFLEQFKHIDRQDEEDRQRLIDAFVNAVYVYEDKLVFIFNYKDGTKTVPLSVVDGSDLDNLAPPSLETTVFSMVSRLFFAFIASKEQHEKTSNDTIWDGKMMANFVCEMLFTCRRSVK